MLMNRPIKRGCMEVYNDYNSNLTNLFFCVKERPLALITELGFLPLNSRDDYDAISRQLKQRASLRALMGACSSTASRTMRIP